LIGGALSAAESIPLVGPFVVSPLRGLTSVVCSIGKIGIAAIGAGIGLFTLGYCLAKGGIYIISSTSSCVYHLFSKTKKAE